MSARDATSGEVLWVAKIESSDVEVRSSSDVGQVEVGTLPNEAWVETRSYDPAVRPEQWEISVDTGDLEPTVIRVSDDELRPGEVVVPGRKPVTSSEFIDDVCGYGPALSPEQQAAVARISLGVVVLAIGLVAFLVHRQRHPSRRGPGTVR